jgi:hypothetical protein
MERPWPRPTGGLSTTQPGLAETRSKIGEAEGGFDEQRKRLLLFWSCRGTEEFTNPEQDREVGTSQLIERTLSSS